MTRIIGRSQKLLFEGCMYTKRVSHIHNNIMPLIILFFFLENIHTPSKDGFWFIPFIALAFKTRTPLEFAMILDGVGMDIS